MTPKIEIQSGRYHESLNLSEEEQVSLLDDIQSSIRLLKRAREFEAEKKRDIPVKIHKKGRRDDAL